MDARDLNVRPGPAARFNDLAINENGLETIIYDLRSHHIHQLNPVTAAVWRLCDGRRKLGEIATLASREVEGRLDTTTVQMALTQLEDADLLAEPLDSGSRVSGQSRRTLLRRAAVAAAVPGIVSISAPTAVQALTAEPIPCIDDGEELGSGDFCCSGESCFIGDRELCGACTCGGRCDPGCTCNNFNICECSEIAALSTAVR